MNLHAFLKEKGYSDQTIDPIYGRDGVVYWYKKAPRTDNHQFIVRMYPAFTGAPLSMPSFEVEMAYETRNGIWANTKYYGLSYTQLCANLDRLEERLRESRLHMDADPLHYRFEGKN